MEDFVTLKNVELDKICRVCLTPKKEMRPLFGELIADMLMEVANVSLEYIDGWPNQICLPCIHQISRCHAFKSRVEKADAQLREYIKGLTVVVNQVPKMLDISQLELPKEMKIIRTNQLISTPTGHQLVQPQIIQQAEPPTIHQQIHPAANIATAQSLNQPIQMLQGAQVVHIQTADNTDPCEIILHPSSDFVMLKSPDNKMQQITHQQQQQQQTTSIPQQIQIQHQMAPQQQHIQLQAQQIIVEEEQVVEEVQQCDDITMDGDDVDGDNSNESEECPEETGAVDNYSAGEEIPEAEIDEKLLLAEFMANQVTFQNNVHVCNLCQTEFKHVKWLQTHMKQHSNWIKANCKQLPQCEICGKSFKGPGMLKMHMKVHSPKINTCSICHKEFKSKSILYRHRQTHFEKSHVCQICQKSFGTNYQLNNHILRHKGEKNFKCNYCEKSYFSVSDLKNHLQSHLGVKTPKK